MVDVMDGYYRGEEEANEVYRKINEGSVMRIGVAGIIGLSKHSQPIRSKLYFCYNFKGHKSSQRVSSKHPGKCPECGRELEEGESRVPL